MHLSRYTSKELELANAIFVDLNPFLATPNSLYPNFKFWTKKILLGLSVGSRSLLVAHHNNKIAGFSILKHTKQENKICTFYINKNFRHCGVGHQLMNESLTVLNYDAIISVNEKLVYEMWPLLNQFKFYNYEVKHNFYFLNSSEYFFRTY